MSLNVSLKNFSTTGTQLTDFEVSLLANNRFRNADNTVMYFYVKGPDATLGTNLVGKKDGTSFALKYGPNAGSTSAIPEVNTHYIKDAYATALLTSGDEAYFAIGLDMAVYNGIIAGGSNKLYIDGISWGNIFDVELLNVLGDAIDAATFGTGSFDDDNFQVYDTSNPTRVVKLDAGSNLENGTEVTLTVPNSTGTISVITDLTKEKTGFVNPADVVVTYDPTNRTITLTGDVRAYWRGKPINWLTSGWVSDAHAAGSGTFFLYSTDGESIRWSNTQWTFDALMVASAFRDTANFCLRECHGLMDHLTHQELHRTVGTYLESGAEIQGITTGTTNRRPTITEAKIWDEDCPTTNAAVSSNYTHMHLQSANTTVFRDDQTDIANNHISGDYANGTANLIYWNQYNGSNWVQTAFTAGQYGKIFVVEVPVTANAECQKKRVLFVQPQQVSSSLTTIQSVNAASINWGHISNTLAEFIVVGEIIVQYQGGGVANWAITSWAKISGTRIAQTTVSGITAVSTDGSIGGLGTGTSPLYVQRSGMKNYFINGCLRRWQERTTVTVTDTILYHADQWRTRASGCTIVSSRETKASANANNFSDLPGTPQFFMRNVVSNSDGVNDFGFIAQHLESVRTFSGDTVTISFWAKSTTGTPKIAVSLSQQFGTGGEAEQQYAVADTITLSTVWTRYSVSTTVPSVSARTIGTADDNLLVRFWLTAGSNVTAPTGLTIGHQNTTFDLAMLQIEKGSIATDFEWDNEAILDQKCMRFYEKTYELDTPPGTATTAGAIAHTATSDENNACLYPIRYKVAKRKTVVPTYYNVLNVSGQWQYARSGVGLTSATASTSADGRSVHGVWVFVLVGVAWTASRITGHWVADARY